MSVDARLRCLLLMVELRTWCWSFWRLLGTPGGPGLPVLTLVKDSQAGGPCLLAPTEVGWTGGSFLPADADRGQEGRQLGLFWLLALTEFRWVHGQACIPCLIALVEVLILTY